MKVSNRSRNGYEGEGLKIVVPADFQCTLRPSLILFYTSFSTTYFCGRALLEKELVLRIEEEDTKGPMQHLPRLDLLPKVAVELRVMSNNLSETMSFSANDVFTTADEGLRSCSSIGTQEGLLFVRKCFSIK